MRSREAILVGLASTFGVAGCGATTVPRGPSPCERVAEFEKADGRRVVDEFVADVRAEGALKACVESDRVVRYLQLRQGEVAAVCG